MPTDKETVEDLTAQLAIAMTDKEHFKAMLKSAQDSNILLSDALESDGKDFANKLNSDKELIAQLQAEINELKQVKTCNCPEKTNY